MKNLIIALVVGALAIAGVGVYQGWFQVGADNTKGKSNVTLSVDKEKIKEDSKAAVAKVEDAGHRYGQGQPARKVWMARVSVVPQTHDDQQEGKEHDHAGVI